MARSVTSKNIFVLTKYSRATIKQSSNTQASQGSKADCEWQHHTQPILRVLLELSKSAQGVPESEDVDLLVVRKHIHPFPTQGLPLKAVYRDNTVGIRYLPPQAKSNAPSEYRRFQMTFQSSSDSATLIEAIRDVCPCKLSPVGNPAPSMQPSLPGPSYPGTLLSGSQQTQASFPAPLQSSQLFETSSGCRPKLAMTQCTNDRPSTSSQMGHTSDRPMELSLSHLHQSRQNNATVPSIINHIKPIIHQQQAYQPMASSLSRHASLSHHQSTTGTERSSPSSLYPTQALRRSESQQALLLQQHHAAQRPSMVTCDERPHPMSIGSGVDETRFDHNVPHPTYMPTPPASSQSNANTNSTTNYHTICSSSNIGTISNSPARSSRKPPAESAVTDALSPPVAASETTGLLHSLYDATQLDLLSRDELERLVAHVVREDGFAELLEKLDNLWQLKAIVNM
ncbi:uncharacterized protein FOMMEDRAFT_28689 [Fomitiporia mediterranea MF3/22]|uniref:uncharacterized protein n=1 Tax=Fomitiporia mediterranea (strain MF3/22) TaxID=694068 RepID=UPI00044093AE|nr:uncharacterized protein FOMMEDRAFT_28689 [Fomitiporia mediterranea MF3/22]EJD03107.1 hypothetical protein FOMMEDRAFT_28689 [Fomitiporia mediterranea MF3/22]